MIRNAVLAAALVAQAGFVTAQEPKCDPCVDGPEMLEHRRSEMSPYPTHPRELARRAAATLGRAISEADLLAYASAPYDKSALYGKVIPLGNRNGVGILVAHWCPGGCPEYTVRVIQLVVPAGSSRGSVGGVEKSLAIPGVVASTQQAFCFPRILVDHWDAYIR